MAVDKASVESAILEGASKEEEKSKPSQKRRGRRSKAEIESDLLHEKKQIEKQALDDWGEVGVTLLHGVSGVVESFAPGCGWTPKEIDAVKAPLARRLNALFPEDSDNADWFAIGAGLGLPLLVRLDRFMKNKAKMETKENGSLKSKD